MTLRKQLCVVLSLLAVVPLGIVTSGPAGAMMGSVESAQFRPHDRSTSRGPGARDPGQGPDGSEPAEEEQEDPCPTERWTIPLEIEGLLCLLLVEVPEEEEPASSATTTPELH